MRIAFFILLLCLTNCQQKAQEQSTLKQPGTLEENLNRYSDQPDLVIIDTVPDILPGTNEQSQTFIKARLEGLVGNFLQMKCREHRIQYPPKFVLFRFFKLEKEFEVWVGNTSTDSLQRILLLPVCAVDDAPGTKLQEGDGKTPEGFYNTTLLYGSSYDFMWIRLNNREIDDYGRAKMGSSFKICLDYPNSIEKQRTKEILKSKSPGSAICIHGNCVSAGCISFKNRNFLPAFLLSMHHRQNTYGPVKIHIFPFRFENISPEIKNQLAETMEHLSKNKVLEIWQNLESGYQLFEKKHKAIQIQIQNNKYSFSSM